MIETLVGTVFGGLFRLAPEVIRLVDRKNERSHELNMLDKQIQVDSLRSQNAIQETEAEMGVLDIQAIIEATKAQAAPTGIKWVDAMNASIRPILALQWLILLWPAVIIAAFILSVQSGTDPLVALQSVFGVDEKTMATSVASFWLVDRSLRKMSKW